MPIAHKKDDTNRPNKGRVENHNRSLFERKQIAKNIDNCTQNDKQTEQKNAERSESKHRVCVLALYTSITRFCRINNIDLVLARCSKYIQ